MGTVVSVGKKIFAAVEGSDEEKKFDTTCAVLENKRKTYIERIKATRGNGIGASREIQGGRSVTRVSEVTVKTSSSPDPRIGESLASFFRIAQGGDVPKRAAVEGAKKLLLTGLDALFGSSASSSASREGFVCLFLNFAFVRIDFMVYSYMASGTKWGANASECGSVYVSDIAVLDTAKDLRASEVDFLLGQCLQTSGGKAGDEGKIIQKLKIQLAQSVLLSQKLQDPDLTIEDLENITTSMLEASRSIKDGFADLEDYEVKPQQTPVLQVSEG